MSFQSRMVLVCHFGVLLGLFVTPRGLALLGWRGAGHLSPGAGVARGSPGRPRQPHRRCRGGAGEGLPSKELGAPHGPQRLWPVSLQTSSEPRAPRHLDLRCSGPFRLRHPHNSGFQYVVREVLRPVSPETSSEPLVPRCPDLRCSGPFRLGHPHNSGFQDAALEVLRPVSPETSSEPRAPRCPDLR